MTAPLVDAERVEQQRQRRAVRRHLRVAPDPAPEPVPAGLPADKRLRLLLELPADAVPASLAGLVAALAGPGTVALRLPARLVAQLLSGLVDAHDQPPPASGVPVAVRVRKPAPTRAELIRQAFDSPDPARRRWAWAEWEADAHATIARYRR